MYVKDLGIGYLLDFYGNTLPEDQRDILTAYYFEDLSLAEIAEGRGLTRQGVRAAIKRGEKQLLFLEERLGLGGEHRERVEVLSSAVKSVCGVADALEGEGRKTDAERLRDAVSTIMAAYTQK